MFELSRTFTTAVGIADASKAELLEHVARRGNHGDHAFTSTLDVVLVLGGGKEAGDVVESEHVVVVPAICFAKCDSATQSELGMMW